MFKLFFILLCIFQSSVCVLREWDRCGGHGHTGETNCEISSICTLINPDYSQCLPRTNDPSKSNEYDQCDGVDFKGKKKCQNWLKCVKLSDHYSHCQKIKLTLATTKQTNITSSRCSQKFQENRLKLGISYDSAFTNKIDYKNFDYISIWLAYDKKMGTNYNKWLHGSMIETSLKQNKKVLFYMYLIGFQGRVDKNLQDCDVNTDHNLCTHGAQFIRDNRELIVDKYKYHANWIAERLGRNRSVIFAIEPDFVQYYSDLRQVNGTLSGEYMRKLFDDFVFGIKSKLPNALISWDVSPWLGVEGFKKWWSFFSSAQIDYVHTSGRNLRPDLNRIRVNELEWKFVKNLTKKFIISNCGDGITHSDCVGWANMTNLRNRINDGVIAVTVGNRKSNIPRLIFNCTEILIN